MLVRFENFCKGEKSPAPMDAYLLQPWGLKREDEEAGGAIDGPPNLTLTHPEKQELT